MVRNLKFMAIGMIFMSGCSTLPTKTLLMEKLPNEECTIVGVKDIIHGYGASDDKLTDIGSSFSPNSAVKTYIYAKLKEKTELLLVDDMTSSDSKLLMLSLIGRKDPSYINEVRSAIQGMRLCK